VELTKKTGCASLKIKPKGPIPPRRIPVGWIGSAVRCKSCGREDKFDFHVPDALWVAVGPVSAVTVG
jgi:hypothetical protein